MKRIASLLLTLLLLAGITACSSGGGETVSIDPGELADKLASSLKFDDQMTALDEEAALSLYALDKDTVPKCKVYVSTGATAEEIAVFEAKDADAAKTVEEAVKSRIEDQKLGFEDYVPAEITKLNDPMLLSKGVYVVLCLSNDNNAAKELINGALK